MGLTLDSQLRYCQEEITQVGIGKRIRVAIEARQLSLKQAAVMCEISYSSLHNWVSELRAPRPEALISIGTCLGISIDWLLTGEGQMFRNVDQKQISNEGIYGWEEQDVIVLFKSLDTLDQRLIRGAIEDRMRLKDLEKSLAVLTSAYQALKHCP